MWRQHSWMYAVCKKATRITCKSNANIVRSKKLDRQGIRAGMIMYRQLMDSCVSW